MRPVDPSDTGAIVEALYRFASRGSEYPSLNKPDFEKGMVEIWNRVDAGDAYVVDGYLVIVKVVTPWYTQESVLSELLVCKLYKGDITQVPKALEQLARDRGCVSVVCSDSSSHKSLAGAYQAAGFIPLPTPFYKDTPCAESSTKSPNQFANL